MLKEECTVAGKDLVSVATSDLRLRLGLSGDAITIGCPNWGREPRSILAPACRRNVDQEVEELIASSMELNRS